MGENLRTSRISCIILTLLRFHAEDHACVPVVVQVDQSLETFEALGDPSILAKHQEL